jgi:hypothetical protein
VSWHVCVVALSFRLLYNVEVTWHLWLWSCEAGSIVLDVLLMPWLLAAVNVSKLQHMVDRDNTDHLTSTGLSTAEFAKDLASVKPTKSNNFTVYILLTH